MTSNNPYIGSSFDEFLDEENLGVAECMYDSTNRQSLEPSVGAIHELPLPMVSYIKSATPKILYLKQSDFSIVINQSRRALKISL